MSKKNHTRKIQNAETTGNMRPQLCRFICPECHVSLKAKPAKAGTLTYCPSCECQILVPMNLVEEDFIYKNARDEAVGLIEDDFEDTNSFDSSENNLDCPEKAESDRIDTLEKRTTVQSEKSLWRRMNDHPAARAAAIISVVVLICFIIFSKSDEPTKDSVPAYDVAKTEDISYGVVRRISVRVSLPKHYSREDVVLIAKDIVADIISTQAVNAINVFFYGPGTSTSGAYDVANIEWVPIGRWNDAGTVKAGDYSTFDYKVSYKDPPPISSSRLIASGKTGILGVPLPVGAKLIDHTPADRSASGDSIEEYALSATAGDILSFFNDAMLEAGWEKDGASRGTTLFFQKGKLFILIVTGDHGGTFRLQGS